MKPSKKSCLVPSCYLPVAVERLDIPTGVPCPSVGFPEALVDSMQKV